MRRSRRGGQHGGLEFGGSGEDSFVAVVVTKLTGALLFILLLTMVIMALLPKVADLPKSPGDAKEAGVPLAIATPETLPEAIAGHPYNVALAARGGKGPLRWRVEGVLPDGLNFDPDLGLLSGTPRAGTPKPATLAVHVSDGSDRASQTTQLVVYESDRPLSTPAWWKPGIPPVPWRAWLEQGFGFLLLGLVHLVGMNTIANLERWSLASLDTDALPDGSAVIVRRRFTAYRTVVRLASLSALLTLTVWLWHHHV